MAIKATEAFMQHKEDHKFDNSFSATSDFYRERGDTVFLV